MRITIVSLVFTIQSLFAAAQPDLVLTNAEVNATEFAAGEMMLVDVTVLNAGSVAADASTLALDLNDGTPMRTAAFSRVKVLAPGESVDVSVLYRWPASRRGETVRPILSLDVKGEVIESDEVNSYYVEASGEVADINIDSTLIVDGFTSAYPILFIHGLNSAGSTWLDITKELIATRGYVFGGQLNYCLNPDGFQSTSDGSYLDFPDALGQGDIYWLNFDVALDGTPNVRNDDVKNVYSNQSAVVKQGLAVADAIKRVKIITGANKVMIVAHSMGGLAAREYIQEPRLWSNTGHDIAKLVTIGTPHGGSNRDAGSLSLLGGIDDDSEGVRDLRYNGHDGAGQYLFGGLEDFNDDFHNPDIDCDGYGNSNIFGLNFKPWPQDVDVSAIIGTGTHWLDIFNDGDGMVSSVRANPSNFLAANPPLAEVYSDQFRVHSNHTDLLKDHFNLVTRALDEPGVYGHPYRVPLNTITSASVNTQAGNNPLEYPHNVFDYDLFTFDITESGWLKAALFNYPSANGAFYISDPSGEFIFQSHVDILDEQMIDLELTEIGTYLFWIVSDPGGVQIGQQQYYFANAFTPFTDLSVSAAVTSSPVCAPATIVLQAEPMIGIDSVSWAIPTGQVISLNGFEATVKYDSPGQHSATVTAYRGSQSSSFTLASAAQLGTISTPSISVKDINELTVEFSIDNDGATPAPTLMLDLGDGEQIPVFTSDFVYTYDTAGEYRVTLSATNACGEESVHTDFILEAVSSTLQEGESSALNIFPNPATHQVRIEMIGSAEGAEWFVIDMTGRLVSTGFFQSREQSINVLEWTSGIYVVQVVTRAGTYRKELIVR